MNIDPIITADLSKLIFIINDSILGDAAHAVIISLIEEFNRIWNSTPNIRHNFELSQYFAISEPLMPKCKNCENCEIVLRYQNAICMSESEFNIGSTKYYFVKNDKVHYNIPKIKYGMIEFYIKHTNESDSQFMNTTYTKISVIKLVDQLQIDDKILCWDNKKIKQIKKNVDIATSRSQTDTLNAMGNAGDLAIISAEKISGVVSLVNEIIDESRHASIEAQVNQISHRKNILDRIPDESVLNLANILANLITSEKILATVILIPNFKSVVLHTTENKCGAILVDATCMIVPTSSQIDYPKISIKSVTPHLSIVISKTTDMHEIPIPTIIEHCKCQPLNSLIVSKIKNICANKKPNL